MLKSYRWVVGGPCDFSVSPSPFGLDFGTGTLDFGLGLDKKLAQVSSNSFAFGLFTYMYILLLNYLSKT